MSMTAVRSGKTPGTAGRRSVVYRDANGKTWEGKVLGASSSIVISDAARAANVVTATVTSGLTDLTVGKKLFVVLTDGTYNGVFDVTAVLTGPDRLQWAQVAADDPSSGAGTAVVVDGLRIELVSMRSARSARIRDHVGKAAAQRGTSGAAAGAYHYPRSPAQTLA